ncbi:MAG: translation initiation factor Sui1 [Pseudomonadota bacterium]
MKTGKEKHAGIVFSTEHGTMCPACNNPLAHCSCTRGTRPSKGDGTVRVSRETKGRKGKGVTIITGLPLDQEGLSHIAKKLKQKCATGGTIKEAAIELQGDHRDRVLEELKQQGYTVKRSGG